MNPVKQKVEQPAQHLEWQDELILVVKRDQLFQEEQAWHGLKEVNFDNYLKVINEKKEFLPRGQMELDANYKQIIPYLLFNFEDKYFLMQRQSKSNESRLASKYSLGIGGHIRQEDLTSNDIIEWSKREFEEEVDYQGNYQVKPLGILNDDNSSVGQVHIGFVLLLIGDSSKIKIKSEHKSGELLTLNECKLYYDKMESWTQFVFDFIKK
ncbi:hypothetical protein M1446_05850 [Candidatus Dependentiae bacterium]|nr:hypothetical protein [Candidatus Dependentiae bacterium]